MADADAGAFPLREVERFFVEEAALLDEWKLEEWMAMAAEDARYLIPSLDAPDADWRTSIFLVADTRQMLHSRVRQLLGNATWAENPRARTRRLVSNVRVLGVEGDAARVTANFAVWHFQHQNVDVYVGRYVNLLVRGPSGLQFRERKAVLDLETLRPHGKIAIIL
jgi:p-cumate 2,3-dioxygenase beta subunit